MMVLEAVDLTKTFTGGDGGLIPVLDGVNLQVARGEMVAIVGASGAGKSTILSLILRLYDPTSGAVKIDAHNLRAVTQKSLREQIVETRAVAVVEVAGWLVGEQYRRIDGQCSCHRSTLLLASR